MKYWLFKTEPNTYSWEDLLNEKDQTTHWEGIRNYQARNLLRDDIKKGDRVLFYHSVVKPMAVVGTAIVVRESYPDHFSWDPASQYFDPKSSPENPSWVMVDVKAEKSFHTPVTLDTLRQTTGLEEMMLLRKGARLSIQPVTKDAFEIITKLGNQG
jgi:predicted RNA-binding protein with PUA-like domain